MKRVAYLVILLALPCFIYSQKSKKKKDKESEMSAEAILESLDIDTTAYLRHAALSACDCIDSVQSAETDRKKRLDGFASCIDEQVTVYQLTVEVMRSMTGKSKTNNIELATKNSPKYERYYWDIERWLKDSCTSLNTALTTDDVEMEKSFSKNPEAMEAYNAGVIPLQKENYEEALPWFKKAVEIDPEFVFAWDNLGICYRRTGKYDEAVTAYQTSLSIHPSGKTAMQNLPVVYTLQDKPDEAISAYLEILKHYPGDAEVYYGIAIVYYNNKKNMASALDYMCKAYKIYVEEKSAYRSDAEKVINMIYVKMKEAGKEEEFNKILKDNKLTGN